MMMSQSPLLPHRAQPDRNPRPLPKPCRFSPPNPLAEPLAAAAAAQGLLHARRCLPRPLPEARAATLMVVRDGNATSTGPSSKLAQQPPGGRPSHRPPRALGRLRRCRPQRRPEAGPLRHRATTTARDQAALMPPPHGAAMLLSALTFLRHCSISFFLGAASPYSYHSQVLGYLPLLNI
ncbi:hypothetical protein PVAP13_9KG356200 [Panicum virgatum]|uniref:Uncharacterized protein n=1 Tax=Panicum virgatum TaxID=38727 RepID=A0A8T0NJH9_PANVG|nr:hypothetical protein PVAP13_9KG356200 [Panicum virgatum]